MTGNSAPSIPSSEPAPASIDELDEAIGRLARHMNTAQYRLLLLVREFDDRFGWAKWSFASCAHWLEWRCGIGLSAAREKVRVAHALRDLPATSAAFEKGQISYSKVRALTRAADALNEQELLDYALHANAGQVEERCRQIRNVRPASVEEARRAWQRRSMSVFRNDARGTMTISIEVPLDAGEAIVRAVDKAVQSGDVAAGAEFGRDGWQAQQADALVAVAKAYLSGGVASEGQANGDADGRSGGRATSADHYQIVVHVDEAALRGGAGRSEMPIETVKRLACDCSITVVTENDRGDPLNVGRRQRIVPLGLRRALWSRDRGCTFPGCRNRRFVEAHHVRHWAHGGDTSLRNTALLCAHHHRLVHEGGLRMKLGPDGKFEFRRTDGRSIPRCGYRADDASPDPIMLEGLGYSSAEGWLAALVSGRAPENRVREEAAVYRTRFGSLGASVVGGYP
ncbi:MAG: DUF222 domain-containing protein [Gammaproteobacteria bacterium]|nr:DUF222 domain-containing protein [Gammaproteobacteria bacterium]